MGGLVLMLAGAANGYPSEGSIWTVVLPPAAVDGGGREVKPLRVVVFASAAREKEVDVLDVGAGRVVDARGVQGAEVSAGLVVLMFDGNPSRFSGYQHC